VSPWQQVEPPLSEKGCDIITPTLWPSGSFGHTCDQPHPPWPEEPSILAEPSLCKTTDQELSRIYRQHLICCCCCCCSSC